MRLAAKAAWLISSFLLIISGRMHAADVTVQMSVAAPSGRPRAIRDVKVVAWLTPINQQTPVRASSEAPYGILVQRNKTFDPHVIVVQVGSAVEFPNRDPFFHNVFSLFNGKRFDLGLYESGSTRSVRFDRSGICYIFCNIHPQMSAVVVVVDTPYFAVSDSDWRIRLQRVPPGRYKMDFWEERCSADVLKGYSRQITVEGNEVQLGMINIKESQEAATAHLNKYGTQYDPIVPGSPLYIHP